jgi:hypothetical protein
MTQRFFVTAGKYFRLPNGSRMAKLRKEIARLKDPLPNVSAMQPSWLPPARNAGRRALCAWFFRMVE